MINPANCLVMHISEGDCNMSFQFDTIYSSQIVKYCVTAFENANKSCLFFMEKVNGKWKIINAPQIQSKFLSMESMFNNFLEDSARQASKGTAL